MAKKKNKKVVRYRRPLNINVGMIIFALIFLYMAFYLYTYLRRDKVEFYEVVEGSIETIRGTPESFSGQRSRNTLTVPEISTFI